jgi:hypothetical protein
MFKLPVELAAVFIFFSVIFALAGIIAGWVLCGVTIVVELLTGRDDEVKQLLEELKEFHRVMRQFESR